MKRVFSLLLILLLLALFPAAALAEENAFAFRNGVTFGMDMTAPYIAAR